MIQKCLDFILILCYKIKYSFTSQRVRKADLGDVVVLDADNNKVETPFQDLESLPLDVVSIFKFMQRTHFITAISFLHDAEIYI